MKKILALVFCLSLCVTWALADTLTLNGTIAAGTTVEVYAPVGGAVEKVSAEVGQALEADDAVAQRFGAVLYLEGESVFTVAASTEGAYNATDTKFVHVGERVYIQCRSSSERSGAGLITSIDGAKYTVRVTAGSFIAGAGLCPLPLCAGNPGREL